MGHNYSEKFDRLLGEVLETSEFAWWEWDIEKNVVTANDLKVTMLGYKSGDFEDAGYQAYTDLLHPDDHERAMQAMRNHLEGKHPLYQIDYRIKRADGGYNWYMDRGRIIERAPDGKPLKLRGLVVDLGEEMKRRSADSAFMDAFRKALPSSGSGRDMAVICSGCKRVKLEKGLWTEVVPSLIKVLSGDISHTICKDCVRQLYPEHADSFIKSMEEDDRKKEA
jgi:PAS domain S-box-containing protein